MYSIIVIHCVDYGVRHLLQGGVCCRWTEGALRVFRRESVIDDMSDAVGGHDEIDSKSFNTVCDGISCELTLMQQQSVCDVTSGFCNSF